LIFQYRRVRAAKNLWIVDALVMPEDPRAVPNLTVIMSADRMDAWLRRTEE
jgi:choline dehydrogenase-like flavoprotein